MLLAMNHVFGRRMQTFEIEASKLESLISSDSIWSPFSNILLHFLHGIYLWLDCSFLEVFERKCPA